MRFHASLWLVASAILSACSGGSGGASSSSNDSVGGNNPVQMNDLTIVYPLAATTTNYIAAKTAGVGGAILPKALYEGQFPPQKKGPIPPGGTLDMSYEDLAVVAVRFDPCFANIGPITDPNSCKNQMRLIFQSLSVSGGSVTAIDGAVHAFYSLTRDQFVAAVEAVAALRANSGNTGDLGPLAPHPLLVNQGLDGAFAAGLKQIILTYAGSSTLTRFTHFMSANLATSWNFEGFDVANGHATPMVIPDLPGSATTVNFAEGFSFPIAGSFTPESTSNDAISLLVNYPNAMSATAAARQSAFDAALRIQNPNFNSPNTIDCASCHVAENAQVLIGQNQFMFSASGDSNAFAPDSTYVPAADFAETTSTTAQANGFNVHMLSYRDTSLFIEQRVINETAAILAYVNGTVIPSSAAPIPGSSGPSSDGGTPPATNEAGGGTTEEGGNGGNSGSNGGDSGASTSDDGATGGGGSTDDSGIFGLDDGGAGTSEDGGAS